MDWKKFITPAVIVIIISALVGVIYSTMAADLKGKADNQTIQMYIMQQEKKDDLVKETLKEQQKANELKQKELDIQQRTLELKQRETETKVRIYHPGE
jgi:uncharacterized membrane protein YhiD involved in acid resistance